MATITSTLVRRPGPYPKGRRCSECRAFLSTYNGSAVCAPHGGWTELIRVSAQEHDRAADLAELMGED